jgi:hypothetical protein
MKKRFKVMSGPQKVLKNPVLKGKLSFSLGANVQIQRCRKKNCSYHVCVFLVYEFSTNATWKHQFLSRLALRVVSLGTFFLLVNRLATGARYCAPIEKEDTLCIR